VGRIEQILREDQSLPKKQCHTAKRIFQRLQEEGSPLHDPIGNWTLRLSRSEPTADDQPTLNIDLLEDIFLAIHCGIANQPST